MAPLTGESATMTDIRDQLGPLPGDVETPQDRFGDRRITGVIPRA
jgi:hypothetical protein